MLEINGSTGEGGGQILRYATALSVLTKTPIRITNIRANRPTPGIRPQHHAAISLLQTISNADSNGLHIGSKTLTFKPNEIQPGSYTHDIATAGSIPLVFQTILLGILGTSKPFSITLKGGTDVKWAPSWDYFTQVFLTHLNTMGITVHHILHQRGYYPKGAGEATIQLTPTIPKTPHQPSNTAQPTMIQGIIHLSHLPQHIATRMKHTIINHTLQQAIPTSIHIQHSSSASPGTGITLWTQSPHHRVGTTRVGEKGIPAERIATSAIATLLCYIQKKATIDVHAFDQLLPYFSLQKQSTTVRVTKISSHAQTVIELLPKFIPVSVHSEKTNKCYQLTIHPNTTL